MRYTTLAALAVPATLAAGLLFGSCDTGPSDTDWTLGPTDPSLEVTDPGCTDEDCEPDPGCTDEDCPPDPGCTDEDCPPDPGCTDGDCPPDPGCTDGDCPPDPGCTDGDCPDDPGCTNGDCPDDLVIDIKPGGYPNSWGCRELDGGLPVALLSVPGFDATAVDADGVTFGKTGTEAVELHRATDGSAVRHVEDVDRDGVLDLVFHFRFGDTGFGCDDIPDGSTKYTVFGQLRIATGLAGADELRLVLD